MARSSSSAAAASATNARNMEPNFNPPPPARHAVYVHDLYRDPPQPGNLLRRELSFLCRALIWGILAFLFVASLSLLMWVIYHPIFPQLHVVSATMTTVNVTGTTATAGFDFTFLLANPNRHLTTIFDSIEFSLFYPSQEVLLSQDFPPPFVQPRRNQTTIETDLGFTGIRLGSNAVKALKEDLDRGSLSLGIKVFAVVRYRNGKWKTKSQFMRAYCGGVVFGFTSSSRPGIFLNPYQECEVYIYTK